MDIDQELNALEENVDLDPVARFERLGAILQELGSEDPRREVLSWEWAAWALLPPTRETGPDVRRGQWFGPLFVQEHGDGTRDEVPDPKVFDTHAFQHLDDRSKTTANPEVAARFADVLWERRGGTHIHARRAFDTYVLLARRRVSRPDKGDGRNPDIIISYTKRAAVLARQLRDASLLDQAAALYREVLTGLPIDLLGIGLRRQLIHDGIPFLQHGGLAAQELLGAGDQLYAKAAEGHTKQLAGDTLARIYDTLGRHDDARAWRLKGAESLERHGDFFQAQGPESALIALVWYQRAAQAYVEIGAGQERLNAVKQKMIAAGKAASGNMKTVSASVEIPREVTDKQLNGILSLPTPEVIPALVRSTWALLDIERERAFLAELREQSVMAALGTTVVTDESGLSHELSGEDAAKKELIDHILRHLMMIYDLLVGPVLKALRGDRAISAQEIITALGSLGTIGDGRLSLIKSGVEAYLRDDFIAAVHVVVPQIEGVIRDLADGLGIPTTSLREAGSRLIPRSLDELLADGQLRELMGTGFASLLEAVYTDPLGMRLRHLLAHGNLRTPDVFTREITEVVLYTLLQVAKYKPTPAVPEGAP